LSVIKPVDSGSDVVLANALFTAAVWITTLAVVALYGARTLRRASAATGRTGSRQIQYYSDIWTKSIRPR
jgi:hypothetical protein